MNSLVTPNDGYIKTEPRVDCYACGEAGDTLYSGLKDRLFDVPGVWSTRRCSVCGLLWLDPTPLESDIPKLYATYFTHDASFSGAGLGSRLRDLSMGVMALRYGYKKKGRTLSPMAL